MLFCLIDLFILIRVFAMQPMKEGVKMGREKKVRKQVQNKVGK